MYIFEELNEDNDDNANELEKNFRKDKKDININDLLNTKITYKSKVMDIESILNALKRGDYILPKYQRKYVWEKPDAANLVLSLIKNIPIPPIYLYFDYNTGKYVVLDGQQRITSLFMYYNNIFYRSKNGREKIDFKNISRKLDEIDHYKKKKEFPVEELNNNEIKKIDVTIKNIYNNIEEEYNIVKSTFNLELGDNEKDITFNKFDDKAKRILRRKDLEVVFVQCENDNADKAYSEIFKLLNSAGKELSSQEIRNGVYYNNILYDYLFKFNNENIIWRKIYGAESLIFKDVEYLLRFLALDKFSYYDNNNKNFEIQYKGTFSYSNIIDDYSEMFNIYLNNKGKDNIEEVNKYRTIEAGKEVDKLQMFFNKFNDIDEQTKMSGKNLLILEAMFISFTKLNLLNCNFKISYFNTVEEIKNDENVQKYILQSTSSKGNVNDRIKEIISLIKGMNLDEC